MKGKKTNIIIEWYQYEKDWRVGLLRFILGVLRFRETGGSGGDTPDGMASSYFSSRRWEWVEVDESHKR